MRQIGKFYWMTAFTCNMSFFSMVAMFSTWGPDAPNWLPWVAVPPSGFSLAEVLTSTLIALIGSVDKANIACRTGNEHDWESECLNAMADVGLTVLYLFGLPDKWWHIYAAAAWRNPTSPLTICYIQILGVALMLLWCNRCSRRSYPLELAD